jgi:hypothetical protein
MRRVHGNPIIDTTRNSDDDGGEKKSTCVVSTSRVGRMTTIGRTRWTSIAMAGGVGEERRRSRRPVFDSLSGLV